MCPACIESAAVMAVGAASAGGMLAVCVCKFKKFFSLGGHPLFQRKEK
jgi:hypothetical protein